jgi:hypothetical protein
VTIDTAGATVVVTNPAPAGTRADTVRARPTAVIGQVEGPPDYTFGAISGLAADQAGRVYVADAMSGDVRAFTPQGRVVRRIGRAGDGPGEFRRPTGLAFDAAGALYVRDETRVQRFAAGPADTPAFAVEASFSGPAFGYSLVPSRLDRARRLYYPRTEGRIPGQRHFYLVFDSGGAVVDTLRVPPSARLPVASAVVRTGRSGGRMVPGLARAPFVPVASWDVTPDGRLLFSDGALYEVMELTPSGDTARIIRRMVPSRDVPAREHADSTRAVRGRVAEAPAPLDRIEGVADEIRTGTLPAQLPQVLSVHAGTDGRIWVQRWPPAGTESSVYDVFDGNGVYQHTVLVPARFAELPAPVFTPGLIYGVVTDAETDVQQVAVFEVGRG